MSLATQMHLELRIFRQREIYTFQNNIGGIIATESIHCDFYHIGHEFAPNWFNHPNCQT
jgi:hypothetical protein